MTTSTSPATVDVVGEGASAVSTRSLADWLSVVLQDLRPEARSLGVRLTDDEGIRELNRRFRERDESTDVLSFPGGDGPEGLHVGDIAISVETARRQAGTAGHPIERELRELALHGLLHCLGYDHESDEGEMNELELSLRRRWVDGEAEER